MMCVTLVPIQELENLKWAVVALAQLENTPGSYATENKANAARGIRERIDWIIRTLKAAGEGERNCGV